MLSNFDYLWKGLLCVCVCVNSTFGRCCDCCKKEKTLYFTKIDKNGKDKNIKKCINNTWYDKYQGKVLLLKEAEEGDTDVLSVTGSGNKWKITGQGKVLGNTDCNPDDNKWIIVKVTTLKNNSADSGGSYIFYVDEITCIQDNWFSYCVFEEIECYSIEIIAANTRAVQNMHGMFYLVESTLERDVDKATSPGLIGLDKLNVENVEDIGSMFFKTIHKQATLDQLKGWRFSGGNKVDIGCLFSSKVEGLNFRVLDGWSSATKNGTVSFSQGVSSPETVFISNKKYNFTKPRWFGDIKEVE